MNSRIDLQGHEQRIERAGGRVQHESAVEHAVRTIALLRLNMPVLFMDLRGLRETGHLLMDRLRHDDTRGIRQ
ncbi:hypothetical protein D3C80_1270800 [compost metagenome]